MNAASAPGPARKSDKPPHGGWFPIREEWLRRIDRTLDSEVARRKAILALVTVFRIANLEGANTFTRPVASIARDMALSYRHALEGLGLLQALGLLTIRENRIPGTKERAPSQYTVLAGEATLLPGGKILQRQRIPKNSANNTSNPYPNDSASASENAEAIDGLNASLYEPEEAA